MMAVLNSKIWENYGKLPFYAIFIGKLIGKLTTQQTVDFWMRYFQTNPMGGSTEELIIGMSKSLHWNSIG